MSAADFDVIVFGAGTAGSAAALQLARSGLRVTLIERQVLEKAGARWVNGVAPWMFDEGGIERPVYPERCSRLAYPITVLDYLRRQRLHLPEAPVWPISVPHLTGRLHRMAQEAGVVMSDETSLDEVRLQGDRPIAATLRHATRGSFEVCARLFVDAAGMTGALRRHVPRIQHELPTLTRQDICLAAQQTRRVRDREGAHEFLKKHGSPIGGALSFLGVDGGFSTLGVHIDHKLEHVDVLTGAMAQRGYRTGLQLLEAFVDAEGWIGEKLMGGQGPIPLRTAYDRFTWAGIALIGNAASQIFPAHGSGTGLSLISAKLLAEAVRGRKDPGAEDALWAYQAAYHRGFGAVCAAYDAFRRYTQQLTNEEVSAVFEAGLMRPRLTAAAFAQQMPRPGIADAITLAPAVGRSPRAALRLGRTSLRMQRVLRHYRRYPRYQDRHQLAAWSRKASWILRHRD